MDMYSSEVSSNEPTVSDIFSIEIEAVNRSTEYNTIINLQKANSPTIRFFQSLSAWITFLLSVQTASTICHDPAIMVTKINVKFLHYC